MKIEGEHVFKGPREEVWEMFYDPEILASALPGTTSLNQVNKNEYQGTITLRIGPVSGSFAGNLKITNEKPPESCTLIVDGKGAPGFLKGSGNVLFTDLGDGTTRMKYDGDVAVGGTLASVGQRMIDSVSKIMIKTGFGMLDKALEKKHGTK
ncbi:MAG: carbon monoxide dehydrogenase subunit G [Anaerolineaceae bacterium]